MIPSEENLEFLRQRMVKEQLLARDIKDKKVLDVFGKVPRHKFVAPGVCLDAYGDFPLSIGKNQTISQPYIVALMAQLLNITKDDRVLEIGTGSGYETAILALLAREVFSIERIDTLAVKAKKALEEFHYRNIHIKTGDGTVGWQEFAPFDKIIVTAGSPDIPNSLLGQLSENGRMVIPVGRRFAQRMIVLEKDTEGKISKKDVCGCVFVPLVGKYAWREDNAGDGV